MRMRHWNHQLTSFDDSKMNNDNGKGHYHDYETTPHADRYKRKCKSVATNLIRSNPSTGNNQQSAGSDFIPLSLLNEIHDSSYHAYIFSIFLIYSVVLVLL
jgi:hypothetical protein